MRVLIVEDNKFDSDLTYRKLTEEIENCNIDIATTIQETGDFLINKYDVVLLDVKLPDGYGTDVLLQLSELRPKPVIIVLTGTGDEEIATTVLKSGADDYIIKKDGYLKNLTEIIINQLEEKKKHLEQNDQVIHVLYLEHHKSDIELTLFHFKRFAPNIHFHTVARGEDILKMLPENSSEDFKYHILLMDYKLPGINALELSKIIRQERKLDIPIIIVTGQGNEEIAIQALKLGVDDYLVKREKYLHRLPSLLISAYQKRLLEKQNKELTESKEKYKILVESTKDGIIILKNGIIQFANSGFSKITGYNQEEIIGKYFNEFISKGEKPKFEKNYNQKIKERKDSLLYETKIISKTGVIISTELHIVNVLLNDIPVEQLLIRDITEHKKYIDQINKNKNELTEYFENDISSDFVSSLSGKIYSCNSTFLKMFGFKDKESAYKFNIIDLYKNPDDREKIIEKIIKNKKVENFEVDFITKNGKLLNTILNAVGIFNDSGELIQIRWYVVDITLRKEAETELSKLSMATEQSPASIVITDLEGNIEYINPKVIEITEYSVKELIGINPRIFSSGTIPKEEYKNLWDTIKSGKKWVGEFQNKKKSGGIFWESASISPIRNTKSEITHFIAVKEDITERKKIEHELKIHHEELENIVKERTKELEEKNLDLEKFNNLFVGREFRIKELRNQIKELKEEIKILKA